MRIGDRKHSHRYNDGKPTAAVCLWSMIVVAGAAAPAAEPPSDARSLANVEVNFEMGPQELPGQKRSPRTRAEGEATEPAPAPEATKARAWFGHRPYSEWDHATGDWGGGRSWLDEQGITFAGNYIFDWSSVWDGGVRNTASSRSALNLNFTFDSEKIAGYKGGSLFVNYFSSDMRGGSEDAGDIQVFDNIVTAGNLDQVSEVWYQQTLIDDKLRLKIGKVDANKDFAFALSGTGPQHTAAGFSPTIFPLPTWPQQSTAAVAFFYPTPKWYVGAGIFDGSITNGNNVGRLGPAPLFRGQEFFYIGETGYSWDTLGGLGRGRAAGGGWHTTGDIARFDGGIEDNTSGGYIVAEQQLWHSGENDMKACKGLWLMVQLGHTDEDVAAMADHFGAGLTLFGTFAERDADNCGFYVSRVRLSGATGAPYAGDETAYELFYRVQITTFAALRPSVFYISNPSGNPSIDDALVGMLRLDIAF